MTFTATAVLECEGKTYTVTCIHGEETAQEIREIWERGTWARDLSRRVLIHQHYRAELGEDFQVRKAGRVDLKSLEVVEDQDTNGTAHDDAAGTEA